MKRILIATLLGGVLIFAWGAFTHMVLPLGMAGLRSMPNEAPVLEAFQNSLPEAGLYFFPGIDPFPPQSPEQEAAWTERHRTGPAGLLVYHPVGGEPMPPSRLLIELLSNILAAAVAAIAASLLAGSYCRRVMVLAALGLFAWFSISLGYWNWYGFPSAFILAEGADLLGGALLAGLVIARIVPPPRQTA